MDPMMTVEDVAQILNVSEASIRRWLRNGSLTGVRVGDQWRIERTDLEEFIKRNKRPKNEKS